LDLALTRSKDVDGELFKAGAPGWDWRFHKPLVQWALVSSNQSARVQ